MDSAVHADFFTTSHCAALLGRPLRSVPTDEGERVLRGARVLVTGAGGSVGSALVPRLLALQPEVVVALDIHEASLFRLARSLPSNAALDLRVGDIRNGPRLRRLLAATRPSVIFHLAAYKHVPFAEVDADEPVSVNVLGTAALVCAAAEHGVDHLIYPSSDKAVNPASAYGATKRIAEAVLLAHASGDGTPAPHIARYVNIIGSSGSVLETFLQLVRAGRPLTLTDLRMARYWMAMEEAVALLFHGLGLPSGSRTLLDPGPSIPVVTMAERLYGLIFGGKRSPEFDLVGARPGERLEEELASSTEKLIPRGGEPIFDILDSDADEHATKVAGMVDELRTLVDGPRPEALRKRLMRMAQALQ